LEAATFLYGFHAALGTCAAFAGIGALVALMRGSERVADDKAQVR
jgi:hypothetical protein